MPLSPTNAIESVLREYDRRVRDEGVHIYNWAGEQIVMPMMDVGGSYRTGQICYLHTKSEHRPTREGASMPGDGEVIDYGNDWKFIGVEIPMGITPAELWALLEKRKMKLLGLE